MVYANRRLELLDVTMQIIAEDGLLPFSMRKVTRRAGVSEALIYKHYETKEKLLRVCYDTVRHQLDALITGHELDGVQTDEQFIEVVHHVWLRYFRFLVNNTYRTIFFFEYRNSPYVKQLPQEGRSAESVSHNVALFFDVLSQRFPPLSGDHMEYLWIYILDTTALFAKRVIQGELPQTPESDENIWRLLFGGLSGLVSAA